MSEKEISEDLQRWLAERCVAMQIVAIGRRTGKLCEISDFLPNTHDVAITLVRVTTQPATKAASDN